jgi:glutamyl-tRNA synthetase
MRDVRVRFAPSPTGLVHIGSLRTALYNYLFAKKNNGVFILRIEDTDQTRYVQGAVDNLLSTLEWCGLSYDEGPVKEGAYTPYFQSQRLELYTKYCRQLLQNGHAYPCFCSAVRLKEMRKRQRVEKLPLKYDGLCRKINAEEATERAAREPHVIRMKIPLEGETVVADIVRGNTAFQHAQIDDQVLLKSDGYPTYHLANVVDDYHMQISHVIRGEEWLPSTPKHLLLYDYLGWQAPAFAHLPLLLNPDRSKLSKRQGDVAVEDYRLQGYLPEALVNFVALLGWNKGDDQELFKMEELIEHFSLERINKAGAIFNREKLDWMNGVYIRQLPQERYFACAAPFKPEHLEASAFQSIAVTVKERIVTLSELKDKAAAFSGDVITKYSDEARAWIVKTESKQIFQALLNHIQDYESITLDNFKTLMSAVQKSCTLKGKDLWMPVRAALTGLTEGPELPAVIELLGKQKIIKFLNQALELSPLNKGPCQRQV